MKSREEIRRRIQADREAGKPAWRFRAAQGYVRERLKPSFRDDASTKALWRYLEDREDDRTRPRLLRHSTACSDLETAFRIRFGRLAHLLPLLEAYFLSGLDDVAIAKKFGLSTAAVYWFRVSFFDIQELLPSPGRILYEVIRIVDESGRPKWDYPKLLKMVGFTLRAPALDQVLGLQDTPVGKIEPQIWLEFQAQAMTRLQWFLATATLDPSNAKQALAILRLMGRGDEKEQDTKDTLHQHIAALLGEIPWAVGDDGRKNACRNGAWAARRRRFRTT